MLDMLNVRAQCADKFWLCISCASINIKTGFDRLEMKQIKSILQTEKVKLRSRICYSESMCPMLLRQAIESI